MSRSNALLAAAAGTWIAAALILAREAYREPRAPDALHQLTGGVGLGASVAPRWSFFTLDARTQSRCEAEDWPLPGLPCPDPRHGTTVWDPPPLD